MKTIAIPSVLIAFLLTVGCGSLTPSSVATALNDIAKAATVSAAEIPNLSPQAAACISAIPPAITLIADVIAGDQPLTTAQQGVGDFKLLLATTCATNAIPAKDQGLITGIVSAIQVFIGIYSQQVTTAPVSQLVLTGYQHGFFDSANPVKAKYKASKADKKLAATVKAKAAAIKAAMAKK